MLFYFFLVLYFTSLFNMASLPDPLATASGPISAYMSGHESKYHLQFAVWMVDSW